MFYSHEILTNSQHGVSTIWYVATVGKKITRKAIQGVDVPKACGTIIEPGAPLALRLQGSLLYGTVRVYSHQTNYVLHDAEKTQMDMMTFFRTQRHAAQDPKAGKTKRKNIVLEDDPDFDPVADLPTFDFFQTQTEMQAKKYSQLSAGKYSQFSPQTQTDASSSRHGSLLPLDLPPSSQSSQHYRLPSVGLDVPPKVKLSSQRNTLDEPIIRDTYRPLVPDDYEPLEDLGINFDAEGNLIEPEEFLQDLPVLPSMPGTPRPDLQAEQAPSPQPRINMDHDEMIIFDEPGLPDAEPFDVEKPNAVVAEDIMDIDQDVAEEQQTEASAKLKPSRGRKKKKPIWMVPDEETTLSGAELRDWNRNYLQHMEDARKKRDLPKLTDLRYNAWWSVVGKGVSNIGAIGGPLAHDFAGERLQARLRGEDPDLLDDEDLKPPHLRILSHKRGRRRTSSEAFSDDAEDRKAKGQKVSHDTEEGRAVQEQDEDMIVFNDDDVAPEMGMEPMSAMREHHSSSMMPWSRPGSAIPGSSVRGHSAFDQVQPSSPLHNRGKPLPSVERQSDPVVPSSDDFGQLPPAFSQASDDSIGPLNAELQIDTGASGVASLDMSSQEFLEYAIDQAKENGTLASTTGPKGTWIGFDQLAHPGKHDKAVAAQAFLHVLSLATKNVITVKQEGADTLVPFGKVRIGVPEFLA